MSKQQNNQKEDKTLHIGGVIRRLALHVHDDIEEGAKWFKIPIALWDRECVYIMQEDRCVFVGNRQDARSFYEKK